MLGDGTPLQRISMRKFLSVAILPVLLAGLVSATPEIDADALLIHVKFLAADELRGRANGSDGLERAAEYIAAQFRSAGLRPGGSNGGWFQPFELVTGLDIGSGNELVIRAGDQVVRLALGSSYYPLAVTPSDSSAQPSAALAGVPLVFAGHGISAARLKYDDYDGLDVEGKAVLIYSHEPQENRRASRLNGAQPLRETTLFAKARAARTRGARALLVVSDPTHQIDQANYALFDIAPDADDHRIPVLRVARDALAPLLQLWELDRTAAEIDRDLLPRSRALTGATIDYTERLTRERRVVRNVVGLLLGADAARSEAVVLGAHYDHVGLGGRYSNSPELTGEIHNGADDNASGVAALIEIARAGAADRSRFPRSLVFVAFAGEERGLFGSAHYVSSPAIPISDTVAMINLDMIGRSNGMVEVGGLNEAPSLAREVDAAAKIAGGIAVRRGGPGAGRSDDSSFANRNVPSLHFFTGFHDDYHRPSDDWPRLDAAGTAQVATLILELAARIAARPDRPQFLNR